MTEKRVAKATVIELKIPRSNRRPDEVERAFRAAGALEPPYDPKQLCSTYVASSILRPNVDAYEVNIDRAGFRLEPTIKLEGPIEDVLKAVRMVIVQEAKAEGRTVVPNEVEVNARLIEMKQAAELERAEIETFLANIAPLVGLSEVRGRTRHDLEATGNAYWEVLRSEDNDQIVVEHLRSVEMRIMPIDREPQEVQVPYWITPCTVALVKAERRFRRYVQVIQGLEAVYFKELGDPRLMSASTGKFYASEEALKKAEPSARRATEVLHFPIYSPLFTPYGIPRWIGAAPAVRGAAASEHINANYFDNKGIPNGILAVTAGEFPDIEAIKTFFREAAQGRENFDKMLLLEIPAQEGSMAQTVPEPKLKFEPLTGVLHQEGRFQDYEKNAERKVGTQYRVPAIFRGDSNDYNRATSETAADVTNEQVFGPERKAFDDVFNHRIFTLKGFSYWRFVSGQATKMDPETLAKMADNGVDKGILVPNEGRKLYSEATGKEYQDEEWGRTPKAAAPGVGDSVRDLVNTRAQLEREALGDFAASTDEGRLADATEEVELEPPTPPPPPSLQ